ncbi:amidohydrolase family protein [Hymenobacter volaticus]|uniref:Amidohydrolase family protein n=1 Tax=Hymenobacter volaticus TaxID=2932254 RepID=A0ABY4GH04_9BACT|nr:amidohydrolase family protein [Hymenobacter volaticus]UOQ69724.1 amidohydrolase family protein [Hymenobacter volaticus]
MHNFVRILFETGVPLLTESDTYGMVIVGFSLHREFALLQSTGMRPYNILLASTVTPARYLNTIATEGTIAVGKNANLVLLEKNPLKNISNTTSIAGVLLQGQWFNRKQLEQLLTEVESAYK